jgi:hypothetical protein
VPRYQILSLILLSSPRDAVQSIFDFKIDSNPNLMTSRVGMKDDRTATARQSSTTTLERLEEQFPKRFPGNIGLGLEDSIEVR